MDNEGYTVEQAVETAVAVAAPIIAATNPKVAAAAELAVPAIELLQQAIALQVSGVIDQAALASLFQSVGQGIQAKHQVWASLNSK